jgi:NADPH:quinone reductase-like Zn-dependent oxidoreductase
MKAIVYTRYGPPDVLQLMELAKPVPADNLVLVKILAASVNALDYRRFEGISPMGRVMDAVVFKSKNKVLGADIAGRVETVGQSVEQFRPGDEVFGIAAGSEGGFAEYACARESTLVRKPAALSFEAAAAVPVAGLTALQALRDHGRAHPGQKVLVVGASGGVGTFAVQLAKFFGADVTAVCSPRNLEMVRSIGADRAIDYTQRDFTREAERYELILAVNGHHSLFAYRRVLSARGTCVLVGGPLAQIVEGILLGPLVSMVVRKKMNFMGVARVNPKDLGFLGGLLDTGRIIPVIDRRYPLGETAQAIRYLVEEHARGKVVLLMQ